MIATHLFGGLGNQLFQFATGLALAARRGVELRLDERYFDVPRSGDFIMNHFGHDIPYIDRKRLPAMRHDGLFRYVRDKIQGTNWKLYKEHTLGFDPAVMDLPDGTYLKGYWQSEKYFRDHADLVRKHLPISTPPSPPNATMMKAQDKTFPVSLHIRRGDYITNAKFNSTHGTCDLDYYERAVSHIAENCNEDITIFAFSDEPDWVEENLKLPFDIKVTRDNEGLKCYEDIRLMSRCRHHIVANSSFSWWGAWLNADPDKIVVAPKQWFADPNMQDHDLVPEDWVTL